MKRSLAASFFFSYIVVLGLWPTSRWWMSRSIMTWSMFSSGIGTGSDHPRIEASFNDGRRLALPIAQARPFYFLYPPGTQVPPYGSLRHKALFRFKEKVRGVDRLAHHICIALPGAREIHYSEISSAERSFPCQH